MQTRRSWQLVVEIVLIIDTHSRSYEHLTYEYFIFNVLMTIWFLQRLNTSPVSSIFHIFSSLMLLALFIWLKSSNHVCRPFGVVASTWRWSIALPTLTWMRGWHYIKRCTQWDPTEGGPPKCALKRPAISRIYAWLIACLIASISRIHFRRSPSWPSDSKYCDWRACVRVGAPLIRWARVPRFRLKRVAAARIEVASPA
jgi:hypothetical protein